MPARGPAPAGRFQGNNYLPFLERTYRRNRSALFDLLDAPYLAPRCRRRFAVGNRPVGGCLDLGLDRAAPRPIALGAMDFTPTGWLAAYEEDPVFRPVEAWDPDGLALVVDERRGRLIRAAEVRGFRGLQPGDKICAAVPAAPGWTLRVWEGRDRAGESWDSPIVLWLVDRHGTAHPVNAAMDTLLEPRSPAQQHEIRWPGCDTPAGENLDGSR